jgi:transposase-like protein
MSMIRRSRRNHTAAFKAEVAMAALVKTEKIGQLAERFDVHVNQVSQWKQQLLVRAADIFADAAPNNAEVPISDIQRLRAKVGRLVMENSFLSKALDGLPYSNSKR